MKINFGTSIMTNKQVNLDIYERLKHKQSNILTVGTNGVGKIDTIKNRIKQLAKQDDIRIIVVTTNNSRYKGVREHIDLIMELNNKMINHSDIIYELRSKININSGLDFKTYVVIDLGVLSRSTQIKIHSLLSISRISNCIINIITTDESILKSSLMYNIPIVELFKLEKEDNSFTPECFNKLLTQLYEHDRLLVVDNNKVIVTNEREETQNV